MLGPPTKEDTRLTTPAIGFKAASASTPDCTVKPPPEIASYNPLTFPNAPPVTALAAKFPAAARGSLDVPIPTRLPTMPKSLLPVKAPTDFSPAPTSPLSAALTKLPTLPRVLRSLFPV